VNAPGTPLTGRLRSGPAAVLHDEVLEPQFRFESAHLLEHYLLIERALLLEYRRMGLLSVDQAAHIGAALGTITADALYADPAVNLSDLSLAVERRVIAVLGADVPVWHVDRSRNDLQATAQLLFARAELRACAGTVLELATTATTAAHRLVELPMPGYTHLQAAQVISPGFYLAAMADRALFTTRRLGITYDDLDRSPLGAGALSGQQLPWDRDRLARLIGCAAAQPHALTAVAWRGWAVLATADLAAFAVDLSRFATDLMAWSGDAYGLVELPDDLAGISAAMPQKKNYPILERIRGRAGHVVALAHDIATVARNTPFSNSVEVPKEGGRYLLAVFTAFRSAVRLFTVVVASLCWRAAPMRTACERSYLGGFTLANELTLQHRVPWRTAQLIVGEYIREALAAGRTADEPDGALFTAIAARYGCAVGTAGPLLRAAFDPDRALRGTASAGSAHPDQVRALLAEQEAEAARLAVGLAARQDRAEAGHAEVDRLLATAGEVA
jgi:argininosuccinate lyase